MSGTILVWEQADGYYARIKRGSPYRGFGSTPEQAIGDLVLNVGTDRFDCWEEIPRVEFVQPRLTTAASAVKGGVS